MNLIIYTHRACIMLIQLYFSWHFDHVDYGYESYILVSLLDLYDCFRFNHDSQKTALTRTKMRSVCWKRFAMTDLTLTWGQLSMQGARTYGIFFYLLTYSLIGFWDMRLYPLIFKFRTQNTGHIYIEYFLVNCLQVNATAHHWSTMIQVMVLCRLSKWRY